MPMAPYGQETVGESSMAIVGENDDVLNGRDVKGILDVDFFITTV